MDNDSRQAREPKVPCVQAFYRLADERDWLHSQAVPPMQRDRWWAMRLAPHDTAAYKVFCMTGAGCLWWWIGGTTWRQQPGEAIGISWQEAMAALPSLAERGEGWRRVLAVVREDFVPLFVSWHEHMRCSQGAIDREHQAIEAMDRLRVLMDGEIGTVPDDQRVEALEKAIALRWTQQEQSYAFLERYHQAVALDAEREAKERDAALVERDEWQCRAKEADRALLEETRRGDALKRQIDALLGGELEAMKNRAANAEHGWDVAIRDLDAVKKERDALKVELDGWMDRADTAEKRAGEQAKLANEMARQRDARTVERDEWERRAHKTANQLKEAIEQRDRAERCWQECVKERELAVGSALAHLRQLAEVGTLSTYEAAVTLNLAIKSLEGVSLDSAEQGPAEPPDNVALVNELWGSGKGEEIDADVGCLRKDVDGVLAKVSEHSRSIAHFQDRLDRMLERLARLEGK